MSHQSRASVAELTAEFERAIESLAKDPLPQANSDTIARVFRFRLGDVADCVGSDRRRVADMFVRIAAIALVKLGLARTQPGPFVYSAITPAGREWLASNPRRK